MSYRIYSVHSMGLCVEGRENILGFVDGLASELVDVDIERGAYPDDDPRVPHLRSLRDSIVAEKDFGKKVGLLQSLLYNDVHCPFEVEADEDLLEAYYNEVGYGEYWNEERTLGFLNAIAPYVQPNSYLGLIGEDQAMWSYVFDGHGGYEYRVPKVDWTCGGAAAGDLLSERLLRHLGHRVQIAAYGDPRNPQCVTLEDLDTNEVILDGEIYTLAAKKGK